MTTPLSNFQKGRRNIGRNCRHLIKVLRQGENSSVTKTKTIIFQFISDDTERQKEMGERKGDRAACMWSSLARVSLSFYLSPGIALRPLPFAPPLGIASQSVGHLQFSISPLSFSCWENYLPSRQFLARAEHRKVKYFSVFGKRTSGCSAARGSVERRGRVHLNVAHVKWNIFQ